ncbi:hypothetical protein SNK03_005090 [Fusarium graminearum]
MTTRYDFRWDLTFLWPFPLTISFYLTACCALRQKEPIHTRRPTYDGYSFARPDDFLNVYHTRDDLFVSNRSERTTCCNEGPLMTISKSFWGVLEVKKTKVTKRMGKIEKRKDAYERRKFETNDSIVHKRHLSCRNHARTDLTHVERRFDEP